MSSGDPNDTAARRQESVRLRVPSSREIDASLPAIDEPDANNRQQPPRACSSRSFEIPISALPPPESSPPPSSSSSSPPSRSISVSGPDPADLGIPITSATTTTRSAEAADRSSPCRVLGQAVLESDDGFRTPTDTIPLTTECPPAPRKPKSRRRTASALLLQDEIESRGSYLAVEVDEWLEILEEEERKKRMKMARRQAGKLVDV